MSLPHVLARVLDALAPGTDAMVQWHAPSECPTAVEVAARARALGAPIAAIDARVVAVPGGFAAEVDTPTGIRQLRSGSCDELATAVALLAVAPPTTPATAPVDPPPAVDPSPPPIVPPAPIEPRPRRPNPTAAGADVRNATPRSGSLAPARDGPRVLVHGTAGYGLVPRVDLGGGLGFAWAWPRASVEASGWVLAPGRRSVDRPGDPTARIMLGAAAIAGCFRGRWSWFELRPCGGLEAGATHVRARGDGIRRTATNPWIAVRIGARAIAWVHPRIGVSVGVSAVVPTLRTRYRLGEAVLFVATPLAVSATLGLELAIGRGPTARASGRAPSSVRS